MKYILTLIFICCLTVPQISCKKYLDAKPDKSLVIPSSVADLQALLDNNDRMNKNCPWAGEGSSDNYYLTDADFNALTQQRYKNIYTWGEEIIFDAYPNDWSYSYDPVYYANIVLESLFSVDRTNRNKTAWDNAKGTALFFRGKSFLSTLSLWAKAYDSTTAGSEPGIPIRLSSDFNITSTRSSIQAGYDQVIADLKDALPLLPATPSHVMRPSKSATFALLARTYLYVQDYSKAGKYADSALQLTSSLLDYNTIAPATAPFPRFNAEVIMHFTASAMSAIRNRIDSTLYNSYTSNDLRKSLFFRNNGDGSFSFIGSYDGSTTLFCGLSTDELYLTRAESYARTGNINAALSDLNTLLKKRWKTGTFIPLTAANAADCLALVLTERRKELLMRHLRWPDIKRLNIKGSAITITRKLNGQLITLPPGDNRFALPLPATVIAKTGMLQNQR